MEGNGFLMTVSGLKKVKVDERPCTGTFQFNGGGELVCNSCGQSPPIPDKRLDGLRCTFRVPNGGVKVGLTANWDLP